MFLSRASDTAEIIPLLAIPLLISMGQVLFKQASQSSGFIASSPVASALTNPYLLFALIVYFLATLWWVVVLRTVPLSRAYPFMALSFFYVPLLAMLLFKESLGWRAWVGIACIIAGIAIAGSSRVSETPETENGSTIP